MRVAAAIFISLLERFPRFETAAYLLVTMIGGKLMVDYVFNDSGPTCLIWTSTITLQRASGSSGY